MDELKFFVPFAKLDPEKRMVYGYASTEALDSQGERVSKDAIAAALPDYMRFANIREMHQLSAVGKTKQADLDEKGLYLAAKIVDDDAWKKVKEEVYSGFSIGGRKTSTQDNTVTALQLTEISLVDRPANPECVIELAKVAGPAIETGPVTASPERAQAARPPSPADRAAPASAPLGSHAVPPVAKADEVKKGMYQVARLAALIDALDELQHSTEWEAEAEGDASPIPDELKAACASLCAVLRGMVAEETAEIEADKEAVAKASGDGLSGAETKQTKETKQTVPLPSADLLKAGARHSKADMERVQAIHDNSAGLGADCGGGKADAGGELAKATEILTKVHNDLAKANESLAKVVAENDTLKKRVEELGKLPAPPKGALKAIEKADDVTRAEEKKDEAPKTPLEAIKKAHQNPTVLKVR
jgi:phage head maturation protease